MFKVVEASFAHFYLIKNIAILLNIIAYILQKSYRYKAIIDQLAGTVFMQYAFVSQIIGLLNVFTPQKTLEEFQDV